MTPKRFLEQFAYLADAPNGITKLRELILQLAVRGKLVAQDPNDEPASVLLERIREEKERLVAEGKVKKTKALPPIESAEMPVKFPESWQHTRFGSVYLDSEAGWSPRAESRPASDSEWGVLKVSAVSWGQFRPDENKALPSSLVPRPQYEVKAGDFLLSRANTADLVARSVVVQNTRARLMLSDKIIRLRINSLLVDARYLNLFNNSVFARAYYAQEAGGTSSSMKNVSRNQIALLPLALPPRSEQSRIVAKVDQLMALCDELEAKQNQRAETQVQLIRAAHQPLAQPSDQAELQVAWRRIRDNFDDLHATVDSVKALRQTILRLAVQGKLVPQDPNDEPASVLLERIREEKERLVAEGKIKKTKALPVVEPGEVPFEVPDAWAWGRFPDLGKFGRGKSKHRPRNDPVLYRTGEYPLVQTGDVARSNGLIRTYTALYNELGLAQSRLWPKDTMCITIAANIADTGILEFDACFPDSVVGFIPSDELGNVRYFEYFMRTAKEHLLDFAPSTAQKNINLGILERVIVPLPPVCEIERIVAKVDQLMALCDELEAKIEANQTVARQFAEAIVAKLAA